MEECSRGQLQSLYPNENDNHWSISEVQPLVQDFLSQTKAKVSPGGDGWRLLRVAVHVVHQEVQGQPGDGPQHLRAH